MITIHLHLTSRPSIIVNNIVYAKATVITVITMEIHTDAENNLKINNESGT